MQWENLTVPQFARAVKECRGVGIIPVGVLEPHASHLPLGTDMFTAHRVACLAAEQEPAIVFPQYAWGMNHEAAHLPGSFVVKRELAFALLENVCDEMGRHGLRRIILLSGHGGNGHFLRLFLQTLTNTERDYCVYYANLEHWRNTKVLETREIGHACEAETSICLHLFPDLVDDDAMSPVPFKSLARNAPLIEKSVHTSVDWYSKYPTMCVGDARKGTAEKGRGFVDDRVADLVEAIRAVKRDKVTPALLEKFMAGKKRPSCPDKGERCR